MPSLPIQPVSGDYFKSLPRLDHTSPRVVMFMGSNIGNYKNENAIAFLRFLHQNMQPNDILLIGYDLRKNPKVILRAYNDSKGTTRRFNLNLLERINRELGGDIDVSAFDHYPYYDPIAGITYSFLVSLKPQSIKIRDRVFHLKKNELIHTEVSQKYSLDEMSGMMKQAGFTPIQHFMDSKEYYAVSLGIVGITD